VYFHQIHSYSCSQSVGDIQLHHYPWDLCYNCDIASGLREDSAGVSGEQRALFHGDVAA